MLYLSAVVGETAYQPEVFKYLFQKNMNKEASLTNPLGKSKKPPEGV